MQVFKGLSNYMSDEQYSVANLIRKFGLSIGVLQFSLGDNEYIDLTTGELLTHECVTNRLNRLT